MQGQREGLLLDDDSDLRRGAGRSDLLREVQYHTSTYVLGEYSVYSIQ